MDDVSHLITTVSMWEPTLFHNDDLILISDTLDKGKIKLNVDFKIEMKN